jgi:energy-coupling factor transporter ATP-binding protein EcfA2
MASKIEFARNISLKQAVALITNVADKATVLVEGHMGSGKSTMLKMLAKALPEYHTGYFDMTNLDLGDLMLPAVQHDVRETEFYPNSLFGMRFGEDMPHIYMFDEFGKAARPLQNAVLPIMLERRVGARKLHPGSLVFATTNLGAEGVGDTMQAHSRNRMIVVTMRKPTADEWIEDFAVDAGIMPEVIAWVRETPQVMQGFEDVEKAEDNPYIFHPKSPRLAFVTPRSLEKASDILKKREFLEEDTVIHALKGMVGERGALDLRSFVALADKLPAWKSVIADPGTCPVPSNPAAVCMLVFTAVSRIEKETVTSWVQYMKRIPKEAQALFSYHAMKSSLKAPIVSMNKAFTEYAIANQYLY